MTKHSIGLALSGGGFRATLFHLGFLKFVANHGLLSCIRIVAGVSGGAITAAHLARYFADHENNFDASATELLRFVTLDTRGRVGRRVPSSLITRKHLTHLLASEYTHLFSCPPNPGDPPELFLLATELSQATSALAVFEKHLWMLRNNHLVLKQAN